MAYVRCRPTCRQYQLCQQFNCDFDFDRLPDHLFIRILDQLEFRQRFNIARVNRRFKEMSDLSITMIESFDVHRNTKFPDVDQFRAMVGMFARNLRSASLCIRPCTMERFDAMLDIEFPRLADIEIEGWIIQVPTFLANCSNLRRLKIRRPYAFVLGFGQSVFPRVESIDFDTCCTRMIERVLARCPNVKHFSMTNTIDVSWQFIRRLNQIFADRISAMESISMDLCRLPSETPLLRDGFKNLCHLRSMRTLRIDLDELTFNDVCAISNSFPNLQVLRLMAGRFDGGSISALSKLKNLIDLDLFAWGNLRDIDICEFVMTSEAEGLRRFEIDGKFSLAMIMNIIERFSRLKNLSVHDVLNENSTCSAVSNFAKHLRRKFARRDLKIALFTENQWLLESRRVRRGIAKIRRAAGGDERRPSLEFDVHITEAHHNDGGFVRRFGKRIEKSIVRMYHRIFC